METKRIEEIVARELRWIDEKYDRVLPAKREKRRRVKRETRSYTRITHAGSHMIGNTNNARAVIVTDIWAREHRYSSVNEAADALGVSRYTISNALHGRTQSKKFRVKYENERRGKDGQGN